jgi:hypothetical protein
VEVASCEPISESEDDYPEERLQTGNEAMSNENESLKALAYTWGHKIDIYIENGLWSSIQTKLNQYIDDIESEGWTATVFNWSGNESQLKDQLTDRYTNNSIEGALLIGDIPYFTRPDPYYLPNIVTRPYDWELMNLVGTETSSPEIYTARLKTSPVTTLTGKSETQLINEYFERNHDYRTGSKIYDHKLRAYKWCDVGSIATSYFDGLYDSSEITLFKDTVNPTGYREALSIYPVEWMFELSHGSPTTHYSGTRASHIHDSNPKQAFQYLESCSCGTFDVTDNIMCAYVFGGDHGLGAIGESNVMYTHNPTNFFEYMGETTTGNDIIGHAFLEYLDDYKYSSSWRGMNWMGDPTLNPRTMGGGIPPGAATNPNPADGATDVNIYSDLSWTAGNGATYHDVYFGTDSTPDDTEFKGVQSETFFDPGTLSTDTTYYWRIDEINSTGTTTGTVWNFTTSSPQTYAILPYSTGFESGSLDQYWSTITSRSVGRIQVTSTNTPHTGNYHLTMDVSTSGTYNTNEAWLNLDLSGETNVDLSFWWKEFYDESHADDGVYLSDDGGASFVKVHDLWGGTTTYTQVKLDIDQLASANGLLLTNTFVMKFQQYDNYAITTDGFAFDDIVVTSGTYTTIPYKTSFETGSLDQYWYTQSSTAYGRIQVTSANTPYDGIYHLTMDVSTSGTYNLNEAWLHLDLSASKDNALNFWWKEFYDETHTQDGVYFSDNGGYSFVKVYNLTDGNTTYRLIQLDIDQLASANGLSLTNTFVVKFQQYDNYPITTDGFAFDAIEVTGQLYASLPYSTGFESELDEYWATQSSTKLGRIQVTSANTPHSGTYHLTMDVSTSGTYNLNEAWLHLDLSGKTNVDLSFWWKEFYDETHTQDGVYFSDDGGASFVKVYNLTDGSTTYTYIKLDVDQLASANGLSLTKFFVVKFQQYDNYPITTDGFAFDDISVTSPTINDEVNIEST